MVQPNTKDIIFNNASYQLSELESLILAHALEFCVPPIMADKEKIFSEFEVLFSQLVKLFLLMLLATLKPN